MPASQEQLKEPRLENINKARAILRGERSLNSDELKKLYLSLEQTDQFAYATEVLLVKIKMDEDAGKIIPLKDYQTLAKYIYKDSALPSSFKFEKALQELGTHDDMATTIKCETLGLAGAIYKRRWQFDHQYKNLTLARFYYKRGFESWKSYLENPAAAKAGDGSNDDGYTAINFAYINEQIAVDRLEELGKITGLSEGIEERLEDAENTREFIIKQFIEDIKALTPVLKNTGAASWVTATVAEAYFGLRQYGQAAKFIQQYTRDTNVRPWEIRTFSQQIFTIAYLQLYQKRLFEEPGTNNLKQEDKLRIIARQIDADKINECLCIFNPHDVRNDSYAAAIPEIKKDGKLGLALSGGGFRASLFHIGVLASLAEKGELKNIEAISCVSGGSILGAFYYLKLKGLLETKTDDEITRQDYIDIVKEIEVEFLNGVQKNLRMRIFSNLWCNLKMLYNKHYSRSHRIGELYEKYLYRDIFENNPLYKDILVRNDGSIYMNDLYINPKVEENESFNFIYDNWKRKNKIPQLVLNATSVNTGHNWQFTASWMGEPPGNIQSDVDVKPRLRRMYYQEAPDRYKQFRLGFAVGASACVPVMFHPMPMHDLYPEIDLQLIDGGLHDNQGIAALIETECKNMIISDASGQMPTNKITTADNAAIFWRSDTILQERLRELQFLDVKARHSTTQLNTLVALHLKNDLQKNPVSWKYCTDPPRTILYANVNSNDSDVNNDLTTYGILRSSQILLSEVRTDLDPFNDTEAYALMYSPYAQTNYEYTKAKNDGITPDENLWQFSKIKPYLTKPDKAAKIKQQLVAAKQLAFKVMQVSKPVKIVVIILAISLTGYLLMQGLKYYEETIYSFNLTVKFIFFFIAVFLIGLISKFFATLLNYESAIRKNLAFLIIMIVGFIISNLYLYILNPIYNRSGKLKE